MEKQEKGSNRLLNEDCSICLSEIDTYDYVTMNSNCKCCGHQFHEHCIKTWIYKFHNDTCPHCRAVWLGDIDL